MNQLTQLKQLVIEATDLSIPLNYFFDLMGNKIISDTNGYQPVNQIVKKSINI